MEAAKRVVELSASAKEAMVEGGQSWKSFKEMINEFSLMKLNGNEDVSQEEKVDA